MKTAILEKQSRNRDTFNFNSEPLINCVVLACDRPGKK